MKQKLILAIAVAMVVPLTGCWEFPFGGFGGSSDTYTTDDYYADYDPSLEGNVQLHGAVLAGDMGLVRDFAVVAGTVEGYRDGWGDVNVTVEARTEYGQTVMAILYFDEGVLRQEPGTVRSYQPYSATVDEPFLDVTGCSSSTPDGTLDFDAPADQVDVTLEPSSTNPGMQTVHFVATFETADGRQQAEGSFDIEIPAESGTTAPGL